jgi:hypothetical protein
MPQDVPLEASDTLAFTPASLSNLANPPSFVLRAATHREKRHQRRLLREEGLRSHSEQELRAEVLSGLKVLWTPESFEKHSVILSQYWEALDEFRPQAAQRRKEIEQALEAGTEAPPPLEFTFDNELVLACDTLIEQVAKSWPRLAAMRADNAEAGEMSSPITVAAIVKDWSNLDVRPERERGYITLDCAFAFETALEKIEADAGLEPGTAWSELQMACLARMFLNEEEAKNFVSPSLSGTHQTPSTEMTISAEAGMSPASASSTTETPATA